MTVRGNERSGGVHVKPVARSTLALPQSSIRPPRTDDPSWLTHALMYFRSCPQMKSLVSPFGLGPFRSGLGSIKVHYSNTLSIGLPSGLTQLEHTTQSRAILKQMPGKP
ncbi:hypothetical protein V6N13_098290 [Hibiscus sabdariffa]|uniref:Uncharacterized protein n=1 Tax=Hibiscus sabdariffa TaxID=183260 RepID=A0ABR2EF22_9ROSI